jgi:hypothetical protein
MQRLDTGSFDPQGGPIGSVQSGVTEIEMPANAGGWQSDFTMGCEALPGDYIHVDFQPVGRQREFGRTFEMSCSEVELASDPSTDEPYVTFGGEALSAGQSLVYAEAVSVQGSPVLDGQASATQIAFAPDVRLTQPNSPNSALCNESVFSNEIALYAYSGCTESNAVGIRDMGGSEVNLPTYTSIRDMHFPLRSEVISGMQILVNYHRVADQRKPFGIGQPGGAKVEPPADARTW